jgi:hypothetical protein
MADEEKQKVGLASKPGLLRTVAGAPLALVKGLARGPREGPGTPTSGGESSLADQWVDFLISQAQAADAVQAGQLGHQDPDKVESRSEAFAAR